LRKARSACLETTISTICQTRLVLIKLAIFAAAFLLVVWLGVKMLRSR
jgi:hypothetical protein